MNLYLFDVDHTLLDVDHIHMQAYEEMYERVFNIKHSLSLPQGEERTTYNIIRCALTGKVPGLQIEKMMKEAVESMIMLYMSRVNPLFVHSNVAHIVGKLGEKGIVGVFTGGARNVTDAIEKASLGRKFDKIFVIGDSPEDIDAAKANNAVSVCVPFYRHTKQELCKAGADIVFDDWKDTSHILEQLK
jgi:phosphoglycolate phosphatase-like HAD superfamily hydrolase